MTRFHEEARKRKFATYRTHILDTDRNAQAFDFNNYVYLYIVYILTPILLDTLDPEGILSPGKQGTWLRKYRDGKVDRQ
ncbi:unnamed protein product [Clonostachys rhizophaga]|uniref:Uncharacterized protein n=1 Tax=Clonostachys rhizophaga TaxID=160324 RepID=A0A9N9YX84_9HYPO|nr:unnamed protein product [Clonostachys rhizophaga]